MKTQYESVFPLLAEPLQSPTDPAAAEKRLAWLVEVYKVYKASQRTFALCLQRNRQLILPNTARGARHKRSACDPVLDAFRAACLRAELAKVCREYRIELKTSKNAPRGGARGGGG